MASQISRAEWNHMGDRMAHLKMRLANQEQRQFAQQQQYVAQQYQAPPPLTEAPPPYYEAPQQARGHYEQEQSLPGLRENEYEFLWEHGSLGLCLMLDETLKVPVVKRLTGSGSSPSISRVEEGDILVFINTRATQHYDMDQVMDLLTQLPKPILLRFESRKKLHEIKIPKLRSGEYEVLWEEGALGLVIKDSVRNMPIVERISGNGTSPGLSKVRVGDTLVLANDRSSAKIGFHGIMAYLQDTRKPLLLRFYREPATPARTSSSSRASEADCYQVQWSDGPFGLTLIELETGEDSVPAVARVTGRSTCAGLRRVAVGDYLIEIGPFKTRELGFKNATKLLRNIEKPVFLKFQAHFD